MNYFSFSGLVNGLVSVVCGTVVFLQNHKSRKNQIYALYCASLAVWSFFYCGWHASTDAAHALFCCRALMMGAIFIPTFHYHHILTLFELETPGRRAWLKLFYAAAILFSISNLTPLFIARVEPRMFFPFWLVPGPFFHPYLALFIFQAFLANQVLWIRSKHASRQVRNEIGWIAFATTTGWVSGCTNFLLEYNIPVAPYLNIAVSIYIAIAALLFFRLGLLDVKMVLKHISIVVLIYGLLLAIVLPATIPFAGRMLRNPSSNPVLTLLFFGVIIGGALSVGPFIYAYLIRHKVWLRGNLTTGFTHELKSPLSAIQSAVSMIRDNMTDSGADARNLSYLEMINNNAARLEEHVGKLLQIAKLQDGELSVQKDLFRLDLTARDVVDHHASAAKAKNLTLSFEPNGEVEMRGDSEKISLALSNMISNAIRYSDSGTISVQLHKKNGGIACSVTDSGRGIVQAELAHIFDRFYQGKNVGKGSGLGLTIAKAWVEAHGGRIWAESDGLGKGTTVTFSVPI